MRSRRMSFQRSASASPGRIYAKTINVKSGGWCEAAKETCGEADSPSVSAGHPPDDRGGEGADEVVNYVIPVKQFPPGLKVLYLGPLITFLHHGLPSVVLQSRSLCGIKG